MAQLQVRTQLEIATENDLMLAGYDTGGTANKRWSVANHYAAINFATRSMAGYVMYPNIYTISGGWVQGTYTYTLPAYIEGPIDPQFLKTTTGYTGKDEWVSLSRWEEEPVAAGGRTLRLNSNPKTSSGRIVWWSSNGPVPTTIGVSTAEILAGAVAVTLTAKSLIAKSGFIKMDGEWMQYLGVTESATTLTLTGLVRGLFGTTAATHVITSNIYWGVAVPETSVWNWLYFLCGTFLHILPLNLANDTQRDHHEFQMRFFQQQADNFKKSYVPDFAPRIRLIGGRF